MTSMVPQGSCCVLDMFRIPPEAFRGAGASGAMAEEPMHKSQLRSVWPRTPEQPTKGGHNSRPPLDETLQALQGVWLDQERGEAVGAIQDTQVVWNRSACSRAPTSLRTLSANEVAMCVDGQVKTAKLFSGPPQRLVWNDGTTWTRASLHVWGPEGDNKLPVSPSPDATKDQSGIFDDSLALVRLEGTWTDVGAGDGETSPVGRIRDAQVIWDEDMYPHQAHSDLQCADDGIVLTIQGEAHKARYDPGPPARLRWTDGAIWVREDEPLEDSDAPHTDNDVGGALPETGGESDESELARPPGAAELGPSKGARDGETA
eukprot:CAMPEP_0195065608 /NCGR_PEP_ID=MMETSP0448-20130528/11220_1 /TAXON_ID=66468 /ORGANISM="Heterocapsa triquestra, Strain CCMP 448" /LENGTH=316 /DNA_ID=CAMNT_0040096731 /DNA_START=1 /DNA_END=948 /DNA_ORIENTATION=-